jgi:hypothetical protein
MLCYPPLAAMVAQQNMGEISHYSMASFTALDCTTTSCGYIYIY